MPSASPSPIKRPSLTERTSSTHSLSSSGRQTTVHKVHRPHTVQRHSRNVSHGKGLSKLGRVQSTASITTENQKTHQRKKSGGTTPPHSPRAPLVKRNSSHVALAKNTSFGNLRKNHSATALPRNTSHGALRKVGLAPAVKQKNKDKDGVFQLGDRSSDEEEEGEWEDSATQSPELTRSNSKTSTPVRSHTPNGEHAAASHGAQDIGRPERTSSPPQPSLRNNNRSAPNLKNDAGLSQAAPSPPDPLLLQQYPRSSRAPPAMSTVSAHVGPHQPVRSDSAKSFTHISHSDATSSYAVPSTTGRPTPALPGQSSGHLPTSSSIEGGVSHFLSSETPAQSFRHDADDSDEDSPSTFLSNYKPQPSESPEKTKTLHKARISQMQSRTQQKLDLQKREISRVGASTPTAPLAPGMGVAPGSVTSLHGRAASRNRNRSMAGEVKAVKQDYETATKHFLVVRRFRNPMLESLNRLKEKSAIPQDVGLAISGGAASKSSRPQSRRGPESSTSVNGHTRTGSSRSFEDQQQHRSMPSTGRSSSRGRGGATGSGRVHFQRQSSHDDIEVTPSQLDNNEMGSSPEDESFGASAEDALIRRIWGSREVYEPGDMS
jgi:hypothetical protein